MNNLNLISNFAEFKELKNIDKSTMIEVLEDVFRHALQKQYGTDENFDIIIADPPYDNFELSGIENLARFLKEGGMFVLSHPGDTPEISGLKLLKTRRYAAAQISVYTRAS